MRTDDFAFLLSWKDVWSSWDPKNNSMRTDDFAFLLSWKDIWCLISKMKACEMSRSRDRQPGTATEIMVLGYQDVVKHKAGANKLVVQQCFW